MKIKIGDGVQFDLDNLLRSRALVQANSGGGKSWLIRLLAEQMFSKVQVIILDPEGEFATLREKYGYVLVGKGGETPADMRSAGLVAEKLLELNASAVCDLYEMKPHERPLWVKAFLTGLMNAPRELWHPCVIVVDEAHKFAPERGKGESEASEAMLSLATAGRKRGFCAVFATQRLGKLNKDAAAELLNVLIGRTFLDLDRDRAADILGITRAEREAFDETLRTLKPGQFYALGPALATKPTLFMVGEVSTTHPEPGMGMKLNKETPTPERVKALLPKLADLPKAAEEKARTVADFQQQIRSLKAQLAAKPSATPDETSVQRVVEMALRQRDKEYQRQQADNKALLEKMRRGFSAIAEQCGKFVSVEITSVLPQPTAYVPPSKPRPLPSPRTQREVVKVDRSNGDASISGPEQRILNAIAWMNSIGVADPQLTAVAFLAGYTIGGGAFNNPKGALRSKGLVEYLPGERICLTTEGQSLAQVPDTPLDATELQRMVLDRLPGPEQKILSVLLENREGLSNEDLANLSGYAQGGGAFNNPKGRLRSLGLIDYRSGLVVPEPLLFLET